jgi:hypothetical protein
MLLFNKLMLTTMVVLISVNSVAFSDKISVVVVLVTVVALATAVVHHSVLVLVLAMVLLV